jgi:hypothetical protein
MEPPNFGRPISKDDMRKFEKSVMSRGTGPAVQGSNKPSRKDIKAADMEQSWESIKNMQNRPRDIIRPRPPLVLLSDFKLYCINVKKTGRRL